jgi:tight adherence protein C
MITDRVALVIALLSGMVLLIGLAVLMLLRQSAAQALLARVEIVVGSGSGSAAPAHRERRRGVVDVLRRLGETIRNSKSLYSEEDIAALEGMLVSGGFKSRLLLPIVLGAKAAFLILVVFGAILYGVVSDLEFGQRIVTIAIALPVGIMGPEIVLRILRRPYLNSLQRGVADSLDLLVVCSEAGMGLESGLQEVAREMRFSNPAIASALAIFLDELRILPDRREAFQNFGRRSGVEGIRRMATLLGQTLQYGTPLGQSLRAMANQLRREQMIRLEAKAVRLPALLVFPLIVFIMPSLFIVLMGPTMMRLMDMFQSSVSAAGG